jgi:hypothetical protein
MGGKRAADRQDPFVEIFPYREPFRHETAKQRYLLKNKV